MAAEEARKLFVAGLPDTITEDILRQLFEATGGTVVEVSLPKDRATGRPRGFGFVTLATADDAQNARDTLDGSLQAGRSISVRPFQAEPPTKGERAPGGFGGPRMGGPPDRTPNAPDRTIYVGNLPYDATQVEVESLFNDRGAGPVVRVSLPTDEEGRKRGFGFVSMPSAESANAAIEALRGADIRGRGLVINLAYPKGTPRPEGSAPVREFRGSPGGFSGGPPGGSGGSSNFTPPPGGGFSGAGRPPPTGGPPGGSHKPDWSKKKKKEGEGEGSAKKKERDRGRGVRDWDDDSDS
jgi:nucleolin